MKIVQELLFTKEFVGRVEWLGSATVREGKMQTPDRVELVANQGIRGEHHLRESGTSKRQVTLIQHEHLPMIAGLMGLEAVDPGLVRRNIVVSGINLAALRLQRFRIGETVLKGTGECAPCSRMEQTLGVGGYEAMIGHSGITAVVESGGTVCIGDEVRGDESTNV
ncbi:MAG: MOSC domain-containing protein [Fuerstiella sp.]|nr:MOSC domain-containing protein [Fuerstiella sp.]MCP4853846.1 MOSC domain-containing protein [Fuerstiella sp.]